MKGGMKTWDIIIETPAGTPQKYSLDKQSGHFRLKKILPEGMVFPFDFGYIPDTKGEDGDPIDAAVLSEFSTFPGCIIECRLIGALLAEQAEEGKMIRNDRFFFVPCISRHWQHITGIHELPFEQWKQMQGFFENYNELEGKKFRVKDVIGPEKALKLLVHGNTE